MASRVDRSHNQLARDKIRTTQLIKRLQDNALTDKPFLTKEQVRCAEILIKKTVPDLKQLEIAGNEGGPLIVQVVKFDSPSTP